MKALVLIEHGPTTNFEIRDIAQPEPTEGQVLVEIAASSLNPIDNKIRGGLPIGPELPAPIGCDFAGRVAAVGNGVTKFKVGDEVFGCAGGVKGRGGTLAEYIAADQELIAIRPSNISFREAAALPLVSITATNLLERLQLREDDRLLIHGGVGGVGHIALQLARGIVKSIAVTVESSEDAELASSLGADEVVLFREEEPAAYTQRLTGGKGFTAIIDTVGGTHLTKSFEAAALEARIATTAARAELDLGPVHAKALTLHGIFMLIPMLHNYNKHRHGEILDNIRDDVEAGKLKPIVDERRFTLAEAPHAYDELEAGRARGKIVIDI
ncbi:zinc-binding dehydrogenase [Chelativorans sp. Marseille-P2723]|uniref:zinc-binding dehydrogenase n=1 Tax=Chelativorans sp. Marseille-P2723 TaxID=2709133 RepID=UPI00156F3803|nr:zinc-binding dehydrogenase [Chelativorans sp. Marseille-P2723]